MPRSRSRRGAAAALALAALVPGLPALSGSPAAAAEPVAAASPLPFDLPSTAALRATGRLGLRPLHAEPAGQSLDDQRAASDYYARNYLDPDGEGGKHAAYGGFLRDRPLPRAVRGTADWRLQDMETDVRQAIAAGLDGFSVDLLALGDTGGRSWTRTPSCCCRPPAPSTPASRSC